MKITPQELYDAVMELTSSEAESVQILSPNPDFGGASYAIYWNGAESFYLDERFEGDTLKECFDKALEIKRSTGELSDA